MVAQVSYNPPDPVDPERPNKDRILQTEPIRRGRPSHVSRGVLAPPPRALLSASFDRSSTNRLRRGLLAITIGAVFNALRWHRSWRSVYAAGRGRGAQSHDRSPTMHDRRDRDD